MFAVVLEPLLGPALAQGRQRLAVPGLGLAANLGELERAETGAQRAEGPARLDLRQLALVAHEHELGLRLLGVPGELRELARTDHGRLVDDEHAPPREGMALAQVAQERCDRRRVDAGLGLELAGGARRHRAAHHAHAVGLPGLSGGVEGEG
ncbi:MAG: hypothetical protein M3N16_02145, partial [Actinomycetota bacterium]|nr:hypothetical protein [Actinomycetota bacterium]